jgi:hypothetical protein
VATYKINDDNRRHPRQHGFEDVSAAGWRDMGAQFQATGTTALRQRIASLPARSIVRPSDLARDFARIGRAR